MRRAVSGSPTPTSSRWRVQSPALAGLTASCRKSRVVARQARPIVVACARRRGPRCAPGRSGEAARIDQWGRATQPRKSRLGLMVSMDVRNGGTSASQPARRDAGQVRRGRDPLRSGVTLVAHEPRVRHLLSPTTERCFGRSDVRDALARWPRRPKRGPPVVPGRWTSDRAPPRCRMRKPPPSGDDFRFCPSSAWQSLTACRGNLVRAGPRRHIGHGLRMSDHRSSVRIVFQLKNAQA